MADVFTAQNLFTLAMLIMLQAVLGFDNLLYITIESNRAPADKRKFVRQMGIGIAVVLRIILLFVLLHAIQLFQDNLFDLNLGTWVTGKFNGHAIIVLIGGAFIMYTALKEISHMLSIEHLGHDDSGPKMRTAGTTIALIVFMNLVFSFDSILSAIALTDVFWIMAVAIVISGILMVTLAEAVSKFLQKNRMYEVLGLFVLFIVGILLLSEGGHLAHLKLFGHAVEPMAKSTFYFVIFVMVLVEVVQSRYQKQLMARRKRELDDPNVMSS